jgi:hypothetical protein
MTVRKDKPSKTGAERRSLFFTKVSKLYLTWAVGIVIGALGLKPTSINAEGVSLSIEKPEIVQGIVFLVCLWETSVLFAMVFISRVFLSRDIIRHMFWNVMPKGRKSFSGKALEDLEKLRAQVRFFTLINLWMNVLLMAIPAIFIIGHNHGALGSAIKAIFAFGSRETGSLTVD